MFSAVRSSLFWSLGDPWDNFEWGILEDSFVVVAVVVAAVVVVVVVVSRVIEKPKKRNARLSMNEPMKDDATKDARRRHPTAAVDFF